MHLKLALAIAALLSTLGCGSGHQLQRLDEDITVHTFTIDYANAFVIARGDSFFMFDAGLESNAPELAEALREEGFDPAKLTAIILSHGHADHAGGAGWFKRKYGTRVFAGARDRSLLTKGQNDTLCPIGQIARNRLDEDQAATYTPFEADGWIDGDRDLEPLVGIPGRLLLMPGHTAGSLSMIVKGSVFVGDLLRGAILGSGAAVHFYMCDVADNRNDIQRLLSEQAPDATHFFTGHFGPLDRAAVIEEFGAKP